MFDLTITRLVESWAQSRRRQRIVNEAVAAAAIAIVVVAVIFTWVAWFPEWIALVVLAALSVLVLAGVVVARWGRTPSSDAVAAGVDAEADTAGLIRTALSVEKGLADCSDETGALVQAQAVERAQTLHKVGAPPLVVPVRWVVVGAVALLLGVSGVGLAALVGDGTPGVTLPDSGARSAFQRLDVRRLSKSIDALDALARQPGVTSVAQRDLERARDHLRKALAAQNDARAAARELDRAQVLVAGLGGRDLVSTEALRKTQPEVLASGLDEALSNGDTGLARRLGEEVLRRMDGSKDASKMKRLGRALAEKVDGSTPAGKAAQKAGQALQAGEAEGALAAMADLMAALGETARYEPRPTALVEAEDAIRDARQQALSSLGEDKAPDGVRSPSERAADAPPTQPGEGNSASPIDMPSDPRQADGGDGTAQGGNDDLRPSGTPAPGGEPEVRVDGSRPPPGGVEGPLAEDGATVAGNGPAQDGDVPQDAPAGRGEGPVQTDGGLQMPDGGGPGATPTAGVSPSAGGASAAPLGGAPMLGDPFVEIEPGVIAEEWVKAQWDGAGQSMGETLREAAAGGRSGLAWSAVHNRYSALAESATRRERVPLTRRSYVRQYFEAIRPAEQESP